MVRPSIPDSKIREAVADAIGPIGEWRPAVGGYSAAGLWSVDVLRGGSVFVKAATTPDTARFLRDEYAVYAEVTGDFMPEVVAWIDHAEDPILIIEDLADATWPPPWDQAQVELLLTTLDQVASTEPPAHLHSTAEMQRELAKWREIGDALDDIVALRVASRSWFETAIPTLLDTENRMDLSGSSLLHLDVRSDNVCFTPGVKLVDWNWAAVGNPVLDVIALLPSLHLEGGPAPWTLLTGEPEIVSALAGYFLWSAAQPPRPDVAPGVRALQRGQGAVALSWAAVELGLSPLERHQESVEP